VDPLHCLATVLGFCLNGFTTIDAKEVGSWPVSTINVAFEGGYVSFVSTDNVFSPNREALPDVCDPAGAGCLHYARAWEGGPAVSDPWLRCKVEYVRPEDKYYQTLMVYAVNRAAMDAMIARVGFVVEAGDHRGVIPLAELTETVVGAPWCREHPTQGRQCRGEPWAGRGVVPTPQ
jgi:hypothetical protein